MNYLKLIVITLALLWALPVQAQVDCGGKTSCLGMFFTVPSGTTSRTSPELDVIDTDATETRYNRIIAWACSAHPLTDDNGTPNDPSDDFPVGCDTNAKKAQHMQDRMRADWGGWRANVLRWEAQQREAAVADGPVLPEE